MAVVISSKNVTFGQENEGNDGMSHTAVGCKNSLGTSLMAEWFGLPASTAGSPDSIPGPGTKIPQAVWCSLRKKKK